MDGRIVNIVDDAPTTAYEIASLVGLPIEPSAEPLTNPWMGPVPRRVENESGLGSGD
jgi:UDP-glucose 4-epimerase